MGWLDLGELQEKIYIFKLSHRSRMAQVPEVTLKHPLRRHIKSFGNSTMTFLNNPQEELSAVGRSGA